MKNENKKGKYIKKKTGRSKKESGSGIGRLWMEREMKNRKECKEETQEGSGARIE